MSMSFDHTPYFEFRVERRRAVHDNEVNTKYKPLRWWLNVSGTVSECKSSRW